MILFLGREIFDNPVSLTCSHSYCQACLTGLKKELSSTETPSLPPTPLPRTLIYKPQVHENTQCFVCAICRKESFGYLDCRDLETDLKTIDASCPHCSKPFMLCNLRKHLETCTPPKKKTVDVNDIQKLFSNGNLLTQLSQPQAQALEKARQGENRSTFQCPYCTRAKYIIYRFFYFIIFVV